MTRSDRRANPARHTLYGERITLRPIEDADYWYGYRWELDPEVHHWAQGDYTPPDPHV